LSELRTAGPAIPERPALPPWCRLVSDRGRVLVEHGETVVTFEGGGAATLLPELLPLLDGSRTIDELEEAMGRPVAPALGRALALLAQNQLLLDGPQDAHSGDPLAAAATFAAAVTRRVTPQSAREKLLAARVAVLGSGPAAAEVARQLEGMGLGEVDALALDTEPGAGSFPIAVPGRQEIGRLDVLNRLQLERQQAWVQVLPYDGRHLVVGPLFLPHSSACRACYRLRRAACSGYEEDFDLIENEPTRAPVPSSLAAVAAGLAGLLALRWLTVQDPSLPGRFYALEPAPVVRLSHHLALRVPRCVACGPAAGRAVPLPWFSERT
jgi:bacteriocin biosynthesis cyclodehydratase domain-containing protein